MTIEYIRKPKYMPCQSWTCCICPAAMSLLPVEHKMLMKCGLPGQSVLHLAGGSLHDAGPEADAGRQAMGTRFVAEPLRAELQQRAYAVAAQLDPESQAQVRPRQKLW